MTWLAAMKWLAVGFRSETTTSALALFQKFFGYVRAEAGPILTCGALVLASPLLTAAILWMFKLLIDDVLIGQRNDLLVSFAGLYLALVLAKIAVDYATQHVEAGVLERLTLALRVDLYRHVLSLSPGSIDQHSKGDILSRLQGDTTRAEYLVFTGPLAILADVASAVFFLAVLLVLSWQLTLVAIVALPAIILIVQRLAPRIRLASRLARSGESSWMSLAEERIESIPVVQSYNAVERETETFRVRCGKVRDMQFKSLVLQARQAAFVELVVAAGGMFVLFLGFYQIAAGALTVGGLIAFIGAVSSLHAPIRALAKASGRIQHAAAGAQRVADILDTPSRVKELPGARTLEAPRGAIAFRGVSFAYPGQDAVLKGVSLQVAPGETVALVGPSGSGKSSLLRLLLRQYDPDRGAVLIDGQDVRELQLASLRRAIAPVFQDPYVLSGTIARNVRYGKPGATQGEVDAVTTAAAIDAFAAAKNGLSTLVGTRGDKLSGGQRQRVGLARALLCASPILLLDEATAAVDSETEEMIQDALDSLAGQRTILLVAHRLSSVMRADRVVVIEEGRIVEEGTPAELMARNSRCRELFSAQLIDTKVAA